MPYNSPITNQTKPMITIDISQLTKEEIKELELQIKMRVDVLETVVKYFIASDSAFHSSDNEYVGNIDAFVEFTQAIRVKTLKEVINTLEEVPIADTYREAIYRALGYKDLFPEL